MVSKTMKYRIRYVNNGCQEEDYDSLVAAKKALEGKKYPFLYMRLGKLDPLTTYWEEIPL